MDNEILDTIICNLFQLKSNKVPASGAFSDMSDSLTAKHFNFIYATHFFIRRIFLGLKVQIWIIYKKF